MNSSTDKMGREWAYSWREANSRPREKITVSWCYGVYFQKKRTSAVLSLQGTVFTEIKYRREVLGITEMSVLQATQLSHDTEIVDRNFRSALDTKE